jgi:glutamine phosphoribosylpyrophosphate amidotransferase
VCSIVGYKGRFDAVLLKKIFDNSRARGLHSFGYSFEKDGAIETKRFLDYNEFLSSIFSSKPALFIAHFRYATSGDYQNEDNNQPITFQNKSIAFNGVISQRSREGMEREFGVELPHDNDGFVLIQKMNNDEFVRGDKIAFAYVGIEEGKLVAQRNARRPLWQWSADGVVAFCSTKDIFVRSGVESAREVKPYEKFVI